MTPEVVAGWILAAAALLGALAYIGGKLRRGVHLLDALERLVQDNTEVTTATHQVVDRELEQNHGSSMKDDLTGVVYTVGNLWGEVEQLRREFDEHVAKGKRT